MGCGDHEGVRGVVVVALCFSLFFVSGFSHKLLSIQRSEPDIFRGRSSSETLPSSSVTGSTVSSSSTSTLVRGSRLDPNRASKRRVPNGADPIHNRRAASQVSHRGGFDELKGKLEASAASTLPITACWP